jgi:hypothetical protein
MKYLNFVGADSLPAPEDLAVMQRELPGWVEEMDGRGVRLLGRPLELPQTAATVRVRDGETLVSDGPFVEAKEFIAGFDLLDCADLDEAIEVAAKGPVSWFMTIEIRPFAGEPRLGEKASAFGRGEDGAATPYALAVWTGGTPAAPPAGQAVTREVQAWRHAASTSWEGRWTARTRPRRSASATATRCSTTGRSSRPGRSSPASTSSAALTASRPSSSRPHTRSPGTTRSRCARSNDRARRSPRARRSLPRRPGPHRPPADPAQQAGEIEHDRRRPTFT